MDLIVDGTTQIFQTDTVVEGDIWVQNGGILRIENATLNLQLTYDEQFHIDVSGDSRLEVVNGIIQSTGGQFWIEARAENGKNPTLSFSGINTWITNHSGIRPYDGTTVLVTGGNVEELQANDQAQLTVSNASLYPVLFFVNRSASISKLTTGPNVNVDLSVPGGWNFSILNSSIDGWQIDLKGNTTVDLNDGEGIVLSVHTPGNLSQGVHVVEGHTSNGFISGSLNEIGPSFTYTNSNIALINVYTFGTDQVLLRNLHVNEVNAEDSSILTIGQTDFNTPLNCNLCQTYLNGQMKIDSVTIDSSDNIPSLTANGNSQVEVMDSNIQNLFITSRENSSISLSRNTNMDKNLHQTMDSGQIIYAEGTVVPSVKISGLILGFTLLFLVYGKFRSFNSG